MQKGKYVGEIAANKDSEFIIALEKITNLTCSSRGSDYVENYHHIILGKVDDADSIQFYITTTTNGAMQFYVPKGRGASFVKHKELFKKAKKLIGSIEKEIDWYAYLKLQDGISASLITTSEAIEVSNLFVAEKLGIAVLVKEVWRSKTKDKPVGGMGDKKNYGILNGVTSEYSEIRVKGRLNAPDWQIAKEEILEKVIKFSSLLSLFFNCEVAISKGPEEDIYDQEGPIVEQVDSRFEPKKMPPSVISQWDDLILQEWLFDSLKMFSQAKLAERSSPSLSFLAYIASIENIGQQMFPLSQCLGTTSKGEDCQVKQGAERAFRKALELCMSGDDAKLFSKRLYGPRSTLIHRGKLLGDDGTDGTHFIFKSFSHNPNKVIKNVADSPSAFRSNFRYRHLRDARFCSRQLLTTLLMTESWRNFSTT